MNENKFYTVKEMADLLSVSKQAIYDKLKQKKFNKLVKLNKGRKVLSEVGYNILFKEFKGVLDKELETPLNGDVKLLKFQLETTLKQLENAQNEINIKNEQIKQSNFMLASEQQNMKSLTINFDKLTNDQLLLEEEVKTLKHKKLNFKERLFGKIESY